MPLWIGAYLADTMRLTTAQHGGYLLLLMAYWRGREPLPDDDEELRSITKTDKSEWKKMRPVLEKFFRVGDGVWWHKRVEAEIKDANARQSSAQAKAKAAAGARWKKDKSDAPSMPQALPEDLPEDMHEDCPTPSPTPGSGIQPGLNSKNSVCDPPTHTLPDSFKTEIQTSRPDLNPDIVWAVFVQKTNPKDQTIAVWKSWIARERAPVKVAVNPSNPLSDPETRASIEAKGVAKGLGAWQEGKEQWSAYKAKVQGAKSPGLTVAQVAQQRTA